MTESKTTPEPEKMMYDLSSMLKGQVPQSATEQGMIISYITQKLNAAFHAGQEFANDNR